MSNYHESLDSLMKQVIQICDPLKIYLFGSHARGTNNENSDIDLLIVLSDDSDRKSTIKKLYNTINNIQISYDLLVVNDSVLEKHKKNIGLIYATILKEGKVIYAA